MVRGLPEAARHWLDEVPDPELPALSITDLGIVRDVRFAADGVLEVALTPTYSGCPATQVIRDDVARVLEEHGVGPARIIVQLSPAWTTDWITKRGRERLREYGIAPPHSVARSASRLGDGVVILSEASDSDRSRRTDEASSVECPRCGSPRTQEQSHFGSTPCKALYRCNACLEPFDYVKPL